MCVYQWNALRLWRAYDMLCPEASVQADPPPWLQSSYSFFGSRSEYAALRLSPHIFSLSAWRLRAPQAENLGSEGTLHERRPAAFTVWCFRASTGGGECAAAGRQWEHFWHCPRGWEAPYQHQVIIRISYNPTSPCEGGVSSSDKFLFKFRFNNVRGFRWSDITTHTRSHSSTQHCEAASAVQLISKLQARNPPIWQLSYLAHPEEEAHVHTHTQKLKMKMPLVWQQQQTHRLSSQLCLPSKMLK